MDYQAACTFWSQWFSNKKRKEKKALEISVCSTSTYSTDVCLVQGVH